MVTLTSWLKERKLPPPTAKVGFSNFIHEKYREFFSFQFLKLGIQAEIGNPPSSVGLRRILFVAQLLSYVCIRYCLSIFLLIFLQCPFCESVFIWLTNDTRINQPLFKEDPKPGSGQRHFAL
jgi:hypothetical protein